MKRKNILSLTLLLALAVAAVSCKVDEIDPEKSIFDPTETELTGFDKWLDDNYRLTYNIQFKYKYEDIESDMDYNVVPADVNKSIQYAQLVKFLWLDAYVEVAGLAFTRQYSPRKIVLVGSPEWKTSTSIRGTAEAGLKVSLFNVNDFDPSPSNIVNLSQEEFSTMHHEFAHILHQTREFDLVFADWGRRYYMGGSWSDRSVRYANKRGMITKYSLYDMNEDFVEIFSHYVTCNDAWWDALKNTVFDPVDPSPTSADADPPATEMTPEQAWNIIQLKIEFVREYMMEKWGIDIDDLRAAVQRRTEEAKTFKFKTEFND